MQEEFARTIQVPSRLLPHTAAGVQWGAPAVGEQT